MGERGSAMTGESLGQQRSCYNCHKSACKEEVMLPASSDQGRYNDYSLQPQIHLSFPKY